MTHGIVLSEPDEDGIQITEDGTRVRVLKNGTLFNVDTKRFMSGPDPEHYPITKENAREMQKRGQSIARQKAREGVLLAALKAELDDIGEAEDGWRAILATRAAIALTNHGKEGTDAARFVGQATGWLTDVGESGGGSSQKAPIDVNQLIELARAIDNEVDARVAKARAIDAKVVE